MSKKRRSTERGANRRRMRSKRWPRLAILGGVILLVAAVLVLKDRAAEETAAPPLAEVQTQAVSSPIPASSQPTLPSPAEELPEAQLARLQAAGQPVLGFYHSTNCAKCKEMMATVALVYPEFGGSVGLVDVDVYDKANTRLLQEARIRAIPTQIFYDRTGQQKTILGVMTAEELRAQLELLAGGP